MKYYVITVLVVHCKKNDKLQIRSYVADLVLQPHTYTDLSGERESNTSVALFRLFTVAGGRTHVASGDIMLSLFSNIKLAIIKISFFSKKELTHVNNG
jgi:hypothetical protein